MPFAHRSPGILQPPCIKDLLKAMWLQSVTGFQTPRVGVLLHTHHGKTVSDSRMGWGGGAEVLLSTPILATAVWSRNVRAAPPLIFLEADGVRAFHF